MYKLNSITMKSLLITIATFLLFFLTFSYQSYAQFSEETGFFPITNFSQEDYGNALPQNWDIIQDRRGIMYFGNDEGILEYDGIRWKLYYVKNETSVKSLGKDSNGRIYVGAIDELGYLEPNSLGKLEYVSLVNQLDTNLRSFNEVWKIHVTSDGVYFQTFKYIFKWDGKKFIHWEADKIPFHTSFKLNDKVFVNQRGIGLSFFKNDKLIKVKNDELFHKTAIFAIIPKDTNEYFVVTRSNGFFNAKFSNDFKTIDITPVKVNKKNQLNDFTLFNAVKINNNTFSIGTWGSGLLIYQNGKIVQLITRKTGINNEVILSQYLDKDNNLWLGLSEGITKIEINSPLTKFDEQLGIEGTIRAITRFNNKIYLATEKGLLYLPNEWSRSNKIYEQNKFVKLGKFQGGCWDVYNYTNGNESFLLVAVDDGILQVDKNNSIKRIFNGAPNMICKSHVDPNILFIATQNGLASLTRKNNKWIFKDKYEGITEQVFNLTEDDKGNLWLGTEHQGILKVGNLYSNSKLNITRFNINNGLPPNSPFYIAYYNKKILVGCDPNIYTLNESEDSFIIADFMPYPLINNKLLISRLKPDKNGNLWVSSFFKAKRKVDIGFISTKDSNYSWIDIPFNTISKGDIHAFHFDDDGIVWFGGSKGLYRYDPTVKKDYKKDFSALVRMNYSKDTIFFGSYFDENGFVTTIQPKVLKPLLKYKFNDLNFEFSAQNTEIEHPVLFSYFMEGYDEDWSEWSNKSEVRYTNLFEGKYVFRVKAKNIYGQESHEASYEFQIRPPWYRTWLAYISYVLLLIILVYIIVKQYTKYLRGVIKLKTKEIRRQKEIVEHKNEEIMDSIKYAQRIQKALLPPAEILDESNNDHFILFKPRDIVSGDFYWFRNIGDFAVVVAADCTGHGVPGAFVSMLGMAFLNEISVEINEVQANDILNRLRALVIKSLRQTGKEGESKDGMDIALYVIDRKNMKLQFAGANNPLILIRNGEIIQVKGDRMPIGYHLVMDDFKNNELEIEKGDMLYTFSDGYQDQFGGDDGSKFKIKKLKQLMVEIYEKPTEEQHKIFDDTIENWKGTEEQIDDILLIGVRI